MEKFSIMWTWMQRREKCMHTRMGHIRTFVIYFLYLNTTNIQSKCYGTWNAKCKNVIEKFFPSTKTWESLTFHFPFSFSPMENVIRSSFMDYCFSRFSDVLSSKWEHLKSSRDVFWVSFILFPLFETKLQRRSRQTVRNLLSKRISVSFLMSIIFLRIIRVVDFGEINQLRILIYSMDRVT